MIPFELVTLIGSTMVGGLTQIWAAKSQAQSDLMHLAIAGQSANEAAANKADKRGGKSANFVKRVIALTSTAGIFAPVWAPLLGALVAIPVSVVFGYMEFRPGFLFFPDKDVLVWKEVITGDVKNSVKIVITPAMSQAFHAVVGYYLGYSVSKR